MLTVDPNNLTVLDPIVVPTSDQEYSVSSQASNTFICPLRQILLDITDEETLERMQHTVLKSDKPLLVRFINENHE